MLLGGGRETSGLTVYWHGPGAQWLKKPTGVVCSAGVEEACLLFSLSNTFTSYGDQYGTLKVALRSGVVDPGDPDASLRALQVR